MSRIGNKVIAVPAGVNVSIKDTVCTVKGPKGELSFGFDPRISPTLEDGTLSFSREADTKELKSLHGLTRSMVWNMVEGVTDGFQKNLQIEGVGFKVELRGQNLLLNLGYSHPILFMPPEGIEFVVNTATAFSVKGIDKQLVGQVAAKARQLRKPEPYKGKGVRYEGEYIRRKAGKAAGK